MVMRWNAPALTDTYSNWASYIQEHQQELAKLLEGASFSGTIPVGAKRYNASSELFERYDGSSWQTLALAYLRLNGGTVNGNVTVNGTLTANAFSGNGASITSLNASNLSSGTVPTARLGSGTASSGAFLRGDQQWTSALLGNFALGPVATPRYRAEHTDGTRFFAGADAGSAFVGGETSGAFLSLYSEGLVRLLFNTGGRADFQRGARTVPASVAFGATPTFNSQESNIFYFGTLTGNVTSMTISNPTDGQTIQIRFVQDGTGGRTVALPSGALVSGSLNTAANAVTWLVITYVASASRWEGTWTRVS